MEVYHKISKYIDFQLDSSYFPEMAALVGTTYYEGIEVYSISNTHQVLGFNGTTVELGYLKKCLVMMRWLLPDDQIEDMKSTTEYLLSNPPTKNNIPEYVRTNDELIYYWEDDTCLFGIGMQKGVPYFYLSKIELVLPYLSTKIKP